MAVTLNASTSTGLVQSADTSGEINLQSNGTTVLGVTSTGTSVTGTQSVSGNLSFNSGYGSSAVAYGCRAWVNFNGTGTPAIRASGNVTSIADNGTGEYTVTLTNAMPDANYAPVASDFFYGETITGVLTTTTFKVYTYNQGASVDPSAVYVAVFR
jgi:hypothetical protein